jgi:predicted outer membrane repeat protein
VVDLLESRRLMAGPSFSFGSPITIPVQSDSSTLQLADMNNDGKLDLITTGTLNIAGGAKISILLGNGDGTFQSPSQIFDFGAAVTGGGFNPVLSVGDLNRDGKLDLVLTRQNDAAVYIFNGNGNGTVGGGTRIAMPAANSFNPVKNIVGDFNNDGWPDVAVGRFDDSRVIFFNGGPTFGATSRGVLLPNSNTPNLFATADFDQDGVTDLALATNTGVMVLRALNQASPQFSGYSNLITGGRFVQAMTVGRLLGPGSAPGITLASTSLSSSSQFIRIPNPLAQAQTYSYAAPFFLTSMTSGDFNGDGFDDVVSGSLSPQGFILGTGRNTGDIDINPTVVGGSGSLSFSYQSGDLNGDGLLDFVAGGGELGARTYLQRVQSLTVTTAVDEDNGNAFADAGTGVSLREAFDYAKSLGGARTITFAPSLGNANAVLNLSGGSLILGANGNFNITIENQAGRITLQQASGSFFNPFTVFGSNTLTLRNLTVSGFFSELDDQGGAVWVDGGATLNIDRVTFRNNFAAVQGGAIYSGSGSTVTVRNSTFTGNNRGALALGGSVTLENNTISGNTNGGVVIFSGTATLNNNIIAGNTGSDVSGGGFTGSNNIVQSGFVPGLTGTVVADPRLNAIANNGGFTDTFSLRVDSPALNAATSLGSVTVDQRGIARPQIGAPDIGAYEAQITDFNSIPTVTTPDGAKWFLFGSVNNERRIYRQAPGQNAGEVGGYASYIALQADGNVVVRQAAGLVYTRPNSSNGIGDNWVLRASVRASDNATWFLGTDGGGGNVQIYRWTADGGAFNASGGFGSRIGSLGGLIVTQTASGDVYYRNGSNFALGDVWVQNSRALAADGATWFVLAPIGSNGNVFRWDANGTFADASNNATYLGAQQDGTIVARKAGAITIGLGSASGLGSGWATIPIATATDGAIWFLGTDGPSGQFNIYRMGTAGQFNFTSGWGTRLAAVGGSIVHRNSAGQVYFGVGSSSGLGSGWAQANTAVAGDASIWFVANAAGGSGDIYRWFGNFGPQAAQGVGVTLSATPGGAIRTVNAAQDTYERVGSANSIGTQWRLLTESLVVTTLADENDFTSSANMGAGTSLREAVRYAELNPGPDTITFATGLNGQTITLSQGWTDSSDDTALRIYGDVTLDGGNQITLAIASGAKRRHILSGGGTFTLRNLTLRDGDLSGVQSGGALIAFGSTFISNVRFTNNRASSGGALTIINGATVQIDGSQFDANTSTNEAGAIFLDGGASLTLNDSTLNGNNAGNGGAVNSAGTFTVRRSTFAGNTSGFNGGALRLFGTATISDSTISGNSAVNGGGGLISHGSTTLTNVTIANNSSLDAGGAQFFEGTASLRNVTVARNTATRSGGGMAVNFADVTLTSSMVAGNAGVDQNDYWGAAPNAASAGNLLNLSASAARIGTLANNGGPTQTIELLPGSPAINAGVAIAGVTTDQRGTARPQGGAVDVGAYERVATAATAQSAAYESITRQAITYTFNADASVTFGRSSVTLTNLTTNQVVNPGTLSWSADGTQATLVLTNQLADGNYRATTSAAAGSTQVDFFVLGGDFNRNRTANFDDLLILAANYNQSGQDNTQGDANYDGVVNFSDLLILATNYNRTLASSAAPAPVLAPTAPPSDRDGDEGPSVLA